MSSKEKKYMACQVFDSKLSKFYYMTALSHRVKNALQWKKKQNTIYSVFYIGFTHTWCQ